MPFINDMIAQSKREKSFSDLSRFTFDYQGIMKCLHEQIIGQEESLLMIGKILKVIKVNIANPQKPLGVFLLAGPTGVGKTQTVRLITQCIYGSQDQFCRIDMNTLSQEHYSASLTGAPPGYVGSKEGNTLFDVSLIEGSYSKPGIVLFDEIEKANPQVIRAILNVIDNGKMILTSGNKTIDFKNTIIFMTSNLGAKKLFRFQNGFFYKFFVINKLKKEKQIVRSALEDFFDPEFLNRIDAILYYKKIRSDFVEKIILLELTKLNNRLEEKNIQISLSKNAIEVLKKSYDSKYGARDICRKFRTCIEPLVADVLLTQNNQKNIEITAYASGFCIENT